MKIEIRVANNQLLELQHQLKTWKNKNTALREQLEEEKQNREILVNRIKNSFVALILP